MAKYFVEMKPSARKELERLPVRLIERIFPKLENLASDPRPDGCRKLKGGRREWRIRIGGYRAVYTIDDESLSSRSLGYAIGAKPTTADRPSWWWRRVEFPDSRSNLFVPIGPA